MPIKFAKPRLMRWSNNAVTDHNRAEVAISYEVIETRKRMANGTLRKHFISNKRKWSTSWDMLPNTTAGTVDGYWGANEMETFFNSTPGAFTLELTYGNSPVETYQVMFVDFTKNLQKRGKYDFYAVTVSMEEV